MDVAARSADSHGDDAGGLATLERALARYPDATPLDRARALAYRADLQVRLARPADAEATLAELDALDLTDDDRTAVAADIEHVRFLLAAPDESRVPD